MRASPYIRAFIFVGHGPWAYVLDSPLLKDFGVGINTFKMSNNYDVYMQLNRGPWVQISHPSILLFLTNSKVI